MKYCCKYMEELDEKEIIDYCPPNLTTLDVKEGAYPIYFCPFCGKEIEGSKKFVLGLKKQVKGIADGTIKTIPLKNLKPSLSQEAKMEAKEGEMYCAIEGCGLVDKTHTAHCIKHGRSTHRIKGGEGKQLTGGKGK